MRLPWTVQFAREWWPYMTVGSIVRSRAHALRVSANATRREAWVRLDIRRPFRSRIVLRERGSDILTFDEVVRQEVYRTIRDHVRECRSIIDLGANIGLTSLYLAASYPRARILAVEPNDDTFDVLTTNLATLTSAGRCKALRAAVWSSDRALSPENIDDPEHYSAFSVCARAEPDADAPIVGLTMGRLMAVAGFDYVDLLKVDIEGAEVELFGNNVSWLGSVGAIAIEFHGDARAAISFDRLVAEHGFDIADDGAHTVLAVRRA